VKRLLATLAVLVVPLALFAQPAAAARTQGGYWMLTADGRVYNFGGASNLGSSPWPPAYDIAATPDGEGYWVVANYTTSNFGDAPDLREAISLDPGEVVTSISSTPSGKGYWLFSDKGRVFPRGDAVSYGDMSGVRLNGPVLDAVATPSGHGYYMVGSDGGIFAFGDAAFHGSTGNIRLNRPVMSMAPNPDGGYWLVAADGGIFAFDAPFFGSMGGTRLNKPVSGIVASPTGAGYLMVASDGGVFAFGDVSFYGSLGSNPPASPVVSIAAIGDPPPPPAPAKVGDRLTTEDGNTVQVFTYGPATPSQYASVTPGTSLVAIDVQGCVPAGGKAQSFNPLDFSLKMSDNTKADAALGDVDGQIDSSTVAPGDCVRGKVGFEVPAGKQPVSILFQPFGATALKWSIA
jgi:hypothetical protein